MDIAALKAFTAVAEAGSFSRAAENLFLTQPAVSKRISALESELGDRLFDRLGRQVFLTEAGRVLLPRARRILMEVDDSLRALSNLSGTASGTLRFATSHHIGLHRLPPALKAFSQAYPGVRLDLTFMDSEAACRAVEHGDIEFGIVTLPLSPIANLETRRIWRDPLNVVLGKTHPLARRKNVNLTDLAQHPAVLPAPNTFTRQIAERAFAGLRLEIDVILSTNYLETIKMLVSVGIGWSVLPETMVDAQIRAVRVPRLSLERSLGVVLHRDRTLSNAARQLIALLDAGPRG
jgi:DNA-binding transcriptional LysR family regulator